MTLNCNYLGLPFTIICTPYSILTLKIEVLLSSLKRYQPYISDMAWFVQPPSKSQTFVDQLSDVKYDIANNCWPSR